MLIRQFVYLLKNQSGTVYAELDLNSKTIHRCTDASRKEDGGEKGVGASTRQRIVPRH